MKRIEAHKRFFIAENKRFFLDEEFIIHMADPRVFIRYKVADMFTGFDDFF